MTDRTKNIVMIAGFALLAILAVAGWTRTPSASASSAQTALPASAYTNVNPSPLANDPNRPVYGQPQGAQPAYGTGYEPVSAADNCNDPVYTNAAYAPPADAGYRTYNRPRVVRSTYVEREQPRQVVVKKQGRSTKKSVAIVAGSAGVGAAIGALAGGGKGAAIGALTGGGAGFLYDRLTHNK